MAFPTSAPAFVLPRLLPPPKYALPVLPTQRRTRTCPLRPRTEEVITQRSRTPAISRSGPASVEENPLDVENPMLYASIYLDLKHNDSKLVSQKVRAICSVTQATQRSCQLMPVPVAERYPTNKQFDEYLNIYENNQEYFYEKWLSRPQQAQRNLQQLEGWFINIIEPRPPATADVPLWIAAENKKLTQGFSAYCDQRVAPHLIPLDEEARVRLRQAQQHRYPQLFPRSLVAKR